MLWTIPLIGAGLYLAVAGLLFAVQRKILFGPDTARPDAAAVGLAGLREITLVSEDGLHLLAWYAPPPPGRPVLAYFHGNGGSLANRAHRLRMFAAAGLGVLMPEYRGFGGNPGTPGEEGFATDARAAMAFLRDQNIPSERLVVYGESIGTGVAVRVASRQPVAALILESPFTSITDIARRRYFFLPVGWLLRDPFDSLSRIGDVRTPLLVLQGARDDIVPPALGRALFGAAREPKEIWVAADAGHNDLMQFGAAEVAIAFIRRTLPEASR